MDGIIYLHIFCKPLWLHAGHRDFLTLCVWRTVKSGNVCFFDTK